MLGLFIAISCAYIFVQVQADNLVNSLNQANNIVCLGSQGSLTEDSEPSSEAKLEKIYQKDLSPKLKKPVAAASTMKNTKSQQTQYQRGKDWKNPDLPFWSNLKYAGDKNLPTQSLRKIRSFPMNYFEFDENNRILEKGSKALLPGILLYINPFLSFALNYS